MKFILIIGANVNCQDAEGNTPLILACKYNHHDLVKMLTNVAKIDVDLANYNGDTALHIACASHMRSAVIILLALGASVECRNKTGHTPVFTACMFGDIQILQLLLYNSKHNFINDHDKDGNSPLMAAIQSSDCTKELVEFLLSLNPDLQMCNHQGNNVLHLFSSECDSEILELIINQDQSLLHKNNCNKEQPLHVAAKHGNKDSVFILIEKLAQCCINRKICSTIFL